MPRYYRKVIRIRAADSPNVRLAEAQLASGKRPTGEMLVPGVMPYFEYRKRRTTWNEMRQCIGLDAQFWKGANLLLYPPGWLDRAERIAETMRGKARRAKGIGIDPAEGGDKTSMAAVDEYGLIELVSKKTPDTAVITSEAKAFMNRHDVPPYRVAFDRGGGGKQHADRLRAEGFEGVRTVDFGEALSQKPRWGGYTPDDRAEHQELRTEFVNRRASLYWTLRMVLDPSSVAVEKFWEILSGQVDYPSDDFIGFGLPRDYSGYGGDGEVYGELRHQLSLMPLLYSPEGRIRMLPKSKRGPDSKEPTLTELIGHSPDEADAVVLALFAMCSEPEFAVIGAM